MNVAQVMHRTVATVRCDETWRDALRMLLGESLNALVVVDTDRRVVGVVTQTDLASRVQGAERAAMRAMLDGVIAAHSHRMLLRWHQAPLWEQCARVDTLMTAPVVTVTSDMPLTTVARLLLIHEIEQIPVVDAARRPVGTVRQRDLVAAIAAGEARPDTATLPPELDAFAAWAYS